jgi:hypothetical protein
VCDAGTPKKIPLKLQERSLSKDKKGKIIEYRARARPQVENKLEIIPQIYTIDNVEEVNLLS